MEKMKLDIPSELKKIRAEKRPTTRGIMMVTQFLAQMLQAGFKEKQLDVLEIYFWASHDSDGRVLK